MRISLTVVRSIPLTRSMFAWVDQDDYEMVMAISPWHATGAKGIFYATRRCKNTRKNIYMHNFISGAAARTVDHRNRNGLNNCRGNLRTCSVSQNLANRAKYSHGRNCSKYKGVHKANNKWAAAIKNKHIGCYPTEEDAARAYDTRAFEMWGEYAILNFPRGGHGSSDNARHAGVPEGVARVDRLSESEQAQSLQDGQATPSDAEVPGLSVHQGDRELDGQRISGVVAGELRK